ncbi:PepSY domain-containing protein [Sphingomonas bacterium]|uniref:PepSY-associated TM helix domain-containing protein n=1 Tax=Sphingomonas bacterium TaxID=1895847 RepID=UPI002608CD98|nr:PepSY-associated TM helix domain-containing protein [Sphingomonas bacterium]MDB5679498.1 hypothetical protein [Sphingomonas bacterium]
MKRQLLRVHTWLGIALGIFWALQGLSGATLVFNRDLQDAALARPGGARLVPLDKLIARSSAAAGAKVTKLESFGPNPMLLLAYYQGAQGEQTLVIDGRNGAVLDRRDPGGMLPAGGAAWGWLLRLHESLLLGDSGLLIVGTSGSFLFASLLIGLWNAGWFAKWRAAARMTRLPAERARLMGWHRLVGIVAVPALLVMVSAGIYLAFAPQLRAVLASTAGYRPAYKAKSQDRPPAIRLSAEQAYTVARTRFPGSTLVRIALPSAKSPVYFFRLLQPDDSRRWAGTSTLAIDPANGAIVDAYDSRSGPLANRLTDAIYSVHTGDVGGVVGRLLVMLAGLALPTLAVTGAITWFRKRRVRAGRAIA